jgi:hypothetical protein
MVIMAKNTNKVTVNEKTLEKLITMCQVQSKMLEDYAYQMQQQGYEINVSNRKKIDLIEVCILKNRKKEH